MNREPVVVSESNLSIAWARVFTQLSTVAGGELAPVVVSVSGFNEAPEENQHILDLLNKELTAKGLLSVSSVATTIFPRSMWNRDEDAEVLYARYIDLVPHLKRLERKNMYGLYFERMISYGKNNFNQLAHIINARKSGALRRTILQLSIFDATRDHTRQRRRGFPCLQHVVFSPEDGGGLSITGFYATQYYFEKAYGNFRGLCDLGAFVAHELNLKLTRMTCIANVASLGDRITKGEARDMTSAINCILSETA